MLLYNQQDLVLLKSLRKSKRRNKGRKKAHLCKIIVVLCLKPIGNKQVLLIRIKSQW